MLDLAEAVIATQGMSKGLRQTEGPQVVVRLEQGPLGAYAKNTDSARGEAGIYLHRQFSPVRLTLTHKGRVQGQERAWEAAASVARSYAGVKWTVAGVYSPDDFGATGRSTWVTLVGSKTVQGVEISAEAGHRFRGDDYGAYNVGARVPAGRFSLDLRQYVDPVFGNRLVASVRLR